MTSTQDQSFEYAIVGGGAAGTMLAIRLLQGAPAGVRIALIESGEPGRGVAYGSDNPAHVLNVPAGGMSMFAEHPSDFVDFLNERDGQADAAAFVPRRDYAAYLARRLEDARAASPAALVHVQASVTRLQPEDDQVEVMLSDGGKLAARHLALTPGNRARNTPFAMEGDRHVLSAWDHAGLHRIGLDDAVIIVGSGLSMVDVVLGLQARAHRGPVTVVSRHGLLPLPHAPKKHAIDFDIHAFAGLGLRQRVRVLRETALRLEREGLPWQSLMDALRHHVRELWQTMSLADRQRFLRHVVRHWDVHRHRIPRSVAMTIGDLQDRGRLVMMPGRVKSADTRGAQIAVQVEDRYGASNTVQADWLVNATGIETRARHYPNPVLRILLDEGHARPGPLGLGIDTHADGTLFDAAGRLQSRLAAIGSLRLGTLWETTAVPDLREDAHELAERWLQADGEI